MQEKSVTFTMWLLINLDGRLLHIMLPHISPLKFHGELKITL